MLNDFLLEGKSVLVTGASSGIGRETAIRLAEQGASVMLTGRNRDALNETLSLMKNKDTHSLFAADMEDPSAFASLIENIGCCDGAVHCAGIYKSQPCRYISESQLHQIMHLNFEIPVLLTKTLLKKRKINKNGSVIFISSILAYYVSEGSLAYGASKSALNAAVRFFALELSGLKIRVNAISPGVVKTNFIRKNNTGISQERIDEDEKMYPLGYGTPEDVANAVVFFLSDASKWITGSNLIIDGGFSLR
ncbi:MAG: SDR family oxidoreductase [Bacteroidales bacterium]|nr:SDR family oxidoreductase [Bacteroidales bacterium]